MQQENCESKRLAIAKAAVELNEHEVGCLWQFLQVLEANHGNAKTPVEDFIVDLPRWWERGRKDGSGLTPDEIAHLLDVENDGLRSWFDDAVTIARHFRKNYKSLLDEEDAKEAKQAAAASEHAHEN
jgi:hypothetical protein